jgi:hypothetical protein
VSGTNTPVRRKSPPLEPPSSTLVVRSNEGMAVATDALTSVSRPAPAIPRMTTAEISILSLTLDGPDPRIQPSQKRHSEFNERPDVGRNTRLDRGGREGRPASRPGPPSVAGELPAPAMSPTSLAAVSGPKPGLDSRCGVICATSWAISASSALIVVQMPLQRVVERNALADQPLAMVDEQPQIEFRALQLRRRRGIQAFAQRRPRDRDRVDAVGLPALTTATPCVGHQPRRDAHNTFSTLDQESLEGARHMPAVLQCLHPFAAELARPDD